ncbi:SIR2 family NAD-dependent protein deacylase [Aureivirga sp. CE67]|uniref:SIR2 family NAD-dependent protein deacylase n=1 Tax=Aureivirga sp. CE67 TaxID=1788983 RepID=UPI0018CA69EA|nr:Sir2 family NAD-dependent protein deacetylase [Aureivirga sp. CE67]
MKEITIKSILKEVLQKEYRNKITFLTGAGISAASGIPTYRGSDGIWVKGTKFHKPEEFGTFEYFLKNPEDVWQFTMFRKKMFLEAKPNVNHELLVSIEKQLGDQFHLITQNIDNLHRRAGSERIFEIHGNNREMKCSNGCKEIIPIPDSISPKEIDEDLLKEEIEQLKCKTCGSWMRPNLLWFDEYYDEKTHKKHSALKVAKNTGVLFILGTSGATNLPMEIARTVLKYGNYVVDVNLENNHFTELLENKKNKLIIRGKSEDILPEILETINECK